MDRSIDLSRLFTMIDADNSGAIELAEFARVVSRLGLGDAARGGAKLVERMFADADADGDGKVSFEEFAAAVGQARRGAS